MATYTYTTSADEDAALAIELMKINGQLAGQQKQPVDLQEMFVLFVADKLTPMRVQYVQAQAQPILQAFINADQPTRDKMAANLSVASASINTQIP